MLFWPIFLCSAERCVCTYCGGFLDLHRLLVWDTDTKRCGRRGAMQLRLNCGSLIFSVAGKGARVFTTRASLCFLADADLIFGEAQTRSMRRSTWTADPMQVHLACLEHFSVDCT